MLRSLRRNRFYTLLNVAGLALGLAACLLIALFVRGELSVDRFHPDEDRIFRVSQFGNVEKSELWARTGGGMAPDLRADFPQIEHVVTIARNSATPRVRDAEDLGLSPDPVRDFVHYTDAAFFEVFGFPLVHGDSETVLDAPDAIVLTQRAAQRYFGSVDPIGKTMTLGGLGNPVMRVAGIAEDPPTGTRFDFDIVAGPGAFRRVLGFSTDAEFSSYWWPNVYTYVKLGSAADAVQVEAGLAEFAVRHRGESAGLDHVPTLEPISDLYLYSEATGALGQTGSVDAIRTFSFIALAILALAAINFVNLTTARAQTRSQEVGVRKAVGAGRGELVLRFLGESVVLSVTALALAAGLAWLGLPLLESVTGSALDVAALVTPGFALAVVGSAVAVGLLAGLYPAFVLSSFEPVRVLRGSRTSVSGGGRGLTLRRALVGTQFAVSIALVAATFVALEQNEYLRTADLGFESEQTVALRIYGNKWSELKDTLEREAGVTSVEASSARPGLGANSGYPYRISSGDGPVAGYGGDADNPEGGRNMSYLSVTPGFDELMGLTFLAGRGFSDQFPSDVGVIPPGSEDNSFFHVYDRGFVINESAARRHGWTADEALGKQFRLFAFENDTYYSDIQGSVVGVVEDFHVNPLDLNIEPLMLMRSDSPKGFSASWALVRVAPGDADERMATIERAYREVLADFPFEASYLDNALNGRYVQYERTGTLLTAFGVLGLIVACLGLFGLVAYAAQSRRREIGVRKVLGASVGRLTWLLLRDFALLSVLAAAIALPLAWWAMSRWLDTFAYHVELAPPIFVGAAAVVALVALVTVAGHAIRAATSDPTTALRAE